MPSQHFMNSREPVLPPLLSYNTSLMYEFPHGLANVQKHVHPPLVPEPLNTHKKSLRIRIYAEN